MHSLLITVFVPLENRIIAWVRTNQTPKPESQVPRKNRVTCWLFDRIVIRITAPAKRWISSGKKTITTDTNRNDLIVKLPRQYFRMGRQSYRRYIVGAEKDIDSRPNNLIFNSWGMPRCQNHSDTDIADSNPHSSGYISVWPHRNGCGCFLEMVYVVLVLFIVREIGGGEDMPPKSKC